ncbi:phenylalanine 4-monooxygenase [Enterovibrio calviensis]|uniref:phenylalanine 4-monooxygenase n=1 Tax=Enterovibrio calviensis TaxID=91359 RepID=UPI00048821E6|nr:phenylalanine 4-monooxygenase [Enterovibrio calviensis]
MKLSHYESKPLNALGKVAWSREEDDIWQRLISRQLSCIEGKACHEYLEGLSMLNLSEDHVPQLTDINKVLDKATGWQLEPVPALIDFDRFFALLASKRFPVATFLRSVADLDYLQEPDYFHEIFGHCAMLTHKAFADFTQLYGQLGVKATKAERVYLARLYWFTVEFGLIESSGHRSLYGGGILSSPAETDYAYSSHVPLRKKLDVVDVMRTPYRIDILQPVYFYLESLDALYELQQLDLMACVHRAMSLGLHPPCYREKIA